MKKIGILLDSSSGLTAKEAKSYGFYFAPILIDFNDKEYKSGINIDTNFLLKKMKPETKISTAAITLGELKKQFDNALKEVEELVFISLSKHLSSINSTAKALAKQYNGKVHVYDSEFITPWLYELIPALRKLLKRNATVKEIYDLLDIPKNHMLATLAPSSLDFLYKGGRITKRQYYGGNLLKIKPIIFVRNGAINEKDVLKTRTLAKTYEKMINFALADKKELEEKGYIVEFKILSMDKKENQELFKKKLEEKGVKKLKETFLAPEIVAHVGPNAMGLGIIIRDKKQK